MLPVVIIGAKRRIHENVVELNSLTDLSITVSIVSIPHLGNLADQSLEN
jgi:hypothetical protein